jgi:CheY-like chemotaxis protein
VSHNKIIIVDDDPDDRNAFATAFEKTGYSDPILFLESGQELIFNLDNLTPSAYPSLIVLDYNMPAMNGGEALRSLKENPFTASIPVVIYSRSFLPKQKKKWKHTAP